MERLLPAMSARTSFGILPRSRCSIRLGEYEQSILEQQRIYQKKSGIISPWIFPKYDGQHTKQQAVTRGWRTFCKYTGISTNVTPYGWRHKFVSINKEMPEGLKRRRVGMR